MRLSWSNLRSFQSITAAAVVVGAFLSAGFAYSWYFADRVAPRTTIGSVSVGGLTRDATAARLEEAFSRLATNGIQVELGGDIDVIQAQAIGLDLNLAQAVDAAFARGHTGAAPARLWDRVSSLWTTTTLPAPVMVDEQALAAEINAIALASDIARRDIRLVVEGRSVGLATDTAPGKTIDRDEAKLHILVALRRLTPDPVSLALVDDPPRTDPASGPEALRAAQQMVSRPLTLIYEELNFTINRDRLGSWLTSEYVQDEDGRTRLVAGLDHEAAGTYVTTIAQAVNVDPVPPQISTTDGRVTGFVPPKVGRAVQEDKLVELILASVTDRAAKDRGPDVIVVPMKISKLAITGLDAESGITEIVGKATTTFTGSPKNRIFNIKNGVKFLSGVVVQPGEEFSTLGTLGTIDNTTGYLPELVIKGDRTTPEFGGGLCQVSTTLFRAVMDAGLPITARRNHSFRVGYYEKDGNGKPIGPGLDATIYEPEVDFKFQNDTNKPILIIGYVVGDKVTFELYGTGDGRTSQIGGPTILTETPAGEPVYIETLDLAPGVIKQVEFPHPGGSTTATYSVTYPDGQTKTQVFTSWYRRWPAKYLKGVSTLSTPTPTMPVTAPFDMP
jgi:vancomycin resistance protein YoaR